MLQNEFKIRCSAIAEIMGGAMSKPTDKQMDRLKDLEARQADITQKPLTDKMREEMLDLRAKRDAPPSLQSGAKTYCQKWLKERLYGRNIEFSSKYTEKGNECEQAGIDMVADRMGYGFISKNEQHYSNEYMTGTPDLVLSSIVEDIKCPWSFATFPLFEDKLPNSDYFWQLQGYMALTGKQYAAVNYCLIDAPDILIEKEARKQASILGMQDTEIELYDEVWRKMTYGDVDPSLKFKRYTMNYHQASIDAISVQVQLCREYIGSLLPMFITLHDPELPHTTIFDNSKNLG